MHSLYRPRRHWVLLFCLLLPGLPWAANDRAEREKARLDAVREQRAQLERKLEQSESTRSATANQLRDTEKEISVVSRHLRELGESRQAARAALLDHERELRRLEVQVAARQAQLTRLLRSQFRPGGADAFSILLAGGDPNEAARDRYFMAQLSRAKAEWIAEIRQDMATTRRLADEVQQRNDKLAELAKREEQEQATLRQRQQDRQALLARVSREIDAQRRELGSLKQNEERLGKLIAGLAKRAEKPGKPTPGDKASRPAASPAEPTHARGAFAALRGKLRPPVRGSVAARFGTRRDDGQSVWKGLFFKAAEGAEVCAVAAGVVVFADWLRGYGNLLIIDHEDDFLSVYGNNQSLLADVGQKVAAGAVVATVGAGLGGGGTAPDSGLYFELRHRGQAFDPARWLGTP